MAPESSTLGYFNHWLDRLSEFHADRFCHNINFIIVLLSQCSLVGGMRVLAAVTTGESNSMDPAYWNTFVCTSPRL